jgi:hypothetical protein
METIGNYLDFLAGAPVTPDTIQWPPDGFACAASLLERSGSYLAVLSKWPPDTPGNQTWAKRMRAIGENWRNAAAGGQPPPLEVEDAWTHVLSSRAYQVQDLGAETPEAEAIRNSLLTILAAADEACDGVGIPGGMPNEFQNQILERLLEQQRARAAATLCRRIDVSKLTVLPKLHTPRTGMTIRSLSHHLALCPVSEVKPKWTHLDHPQLGNNRHGLNVLVVPWPLDIEPCAFSAATPASGPLSNMDKSYGFFDYQVRGNAPLDVVLLHSLVKKAISSVGSVDLIVFPELALAESDMEQLAGMLSSLDPQPILVGGVCLQASEENGMCRNTSVTIVPIKGARRRAFALSQDKHHRWLLDGGQVKQYGLGCVLDPTVSWWEHTAVSRRELGFLSLQPWLTLCTLICEDLARPDPIANLVRAVGPNLIIALLMDGPQLASRWSARYGTVLADDPGSSVLTVSPLGMVKLSRPRGMPASNVVALWKDAHSGAPIEIAMPKENKAVLVSLTRSWHREFTADGRDDRGTTSYLTLSGVYPV